MDELGTDPWPDTQTPDWTVNIRFSFADPAKTIPADWAADMLCRWNKRNPANFGNELAETSKRWAQDKFGSEDK